MPSQRSTIRPLISKQPTSRHSATAVTFSFTRSVRPGSLATAGAHTTVRPVGVSEVALDTRREGMFKAKAAFSGFSVNDLPTAKKFYAETLGLNVEDGGVGERVHLTR